MALIMYDDYLRGKCRVKADARFGITILEKDHLQAPPEAAFPRLMSR